MSRRAAVLALVFLPAALFAQGGDLPAPPDAAGSEAGPSPEEAVKKEILKKMACEKAGDCEKSDSAGGDKYEKLGQKKQGAASPKNKDSAMGEAKLRKLGGGPKEKPPPGVPPGAPPGEADGAPPGLLRDVEDQEGAPVGPASGDGPGPEPREDAGVTSESRSRQQRSVGTAVRRAESMLRGMNSTEGEGPGRASPDHARNPASETARGPGERQTSAADLAHPKTSKELVLAAHSGFGGSFRALGLKAGSGPGGEPAVLRKDGSPATAAELAALKARIESEPSALLRRPDFFEVLPRDRFESLRRDYGGRPELRSSSFQDVGASERQRDFFWSASCDHLSGNCNPNAERASYKKGEDVSPEDLSRIWSDIAKDGEEEEPIFEEYTEAERRESEEAERLRERIGRSAFGEDAGKGLAGLLGSLGAAARSFLDGGYHPDSEEPGVRIGEGGGGVFAVARKPGETARAPLSGTHSPAAGAPQIKAPPRGSGRRSFFLGAAALAAALIWAGLRRR